MLQDRQHYRKHYAGPGEMVLGGETLHLDCIDVSTKGVRVVITPGHWLATVADFEAQLLQDRSAEVYIPNLTLAGGVHIAWVRQVDDTIQLGLEFMDVINSAHKLWHKRRSYRKEQAFQAVLYLDSNRFEVQGINCSRDGMCLQLPFIHPQVSVDSLVKLKVKSLDLTAIGKIVWLRLEDDSTTLGLQLITLS